MSSLPLLVHAEAFGTGHVQGIAIDTARKFLYCSFTTELIKTDLAGRVIGSVKGLAGHLGCIGFNDEDGKVYGSLEFKHDQIGKGILSRLDGKEVEDGFYIAIFDVDKIDRVGMDAEESGVMTAVFLRDVTDDYNAPGHRFGCSGIDGMTFAPLPGTTGGKRYLFVAYGIYSELDRADNDHQVILCYDIAGWGALARPLDQSAMHRSGPEHADHRYFFYTGNTDFGIQNLEYDPYLARMLAAVYPGHKDTFPNYPMYVIDWAKPAVFTSLSGLDEPGERLAMAPYGQFDEKTGLYGLDFDYGSTGMIALGDGLYYFSHNREDWQKGVFECDVKLYRADGETGFSMVKE